MAEQILSPAEAGVRSNTGAERMREECRAGRLGHYMSGTRFKIPESRLDEWIREQSEPRQGGKVQ